MRSSRAAPVSRPIAFVVAGLLAATTGWALGNRGSAVHAIGAPTPPRSFLNVVNPACTPSRNTASLLYGIGPFCLPRDAIPSIDHPMFATAASERLLSPAEPVLALNLAGVHRAYPLRALVGHEIVNDTIAGTPVVVTFCPICNSGVAFERSVPDRTLTFGVSGQLLHGNLVLYDRQTGTLWQQLTGHALDGPLRGTTLTQIPVQVLSFGQFQQEAPNALVLEQPTDDGIPGEDPYVHLGLHVRRPSIFQFGSTADPRLPPRLRVLGVDASGRAVAFVFPSRPGAFSAARVGLGGDRLVALMSYGTGRPSTSRSYAHERMGWVGAVFSSRLGGRAVSLRPAETGFIDARTGARFTVAGLAVSGPLAGMQLEPIASVDAFWWAWSAFHPRTRLVRAELRP